ncbi:Uncharacterised protein [Moellerella wisconsensis]|nr:Uncharacterised protein [Moellerella wisconsensis]
MLFAGGKAKFIIQYEIIQLYLKVILQYILLLQYDE